MAPTPRMTVRVAAIALAGGLLLGGSAWGAQPIGVDEFLGSPGAVAFKENRFEEAIAGFEALLHDHPGDTAILRYIGISYDRLGQFEQALAAFEKGLATDPDNAVLHFFLGISAFKLHDIERSKAAFAKVTALSPDTVYGKRAQNYLDALNQQAATYERPGAPRRWDLYMQVGSQYDDNVRIAADIVGGDKNSAVMFQYVAGGYDIFRDGPWQLRAEASSYHNQHIDRTHKALDLSTAEGGIKLAYSGSIFGRPITPSLRYGWQLVWVDQNEFSDNHRVNTSISVNFTDNTLTQLTHELGIDNFREDGFDPDISGRDGFVNTFGLSQYFFFGQRQHYVWASYLFKLNDADGVNFDFHGHEAILGGSFALPYKFRIDLSGRYAYEMYDHTLGPTDRRDARLGYSAAVSREITEGLAFSLGYSFTDVDSNLEVLEYDRGILSLNLGYRF